MGDQPVDSPFLGAPLGTGMDDLDLRTPAFDNSYNMYPPPANFSSGLLEAELESDDMDVPPLVGSQFPDVPLRLSTPDMAPPGIALEKIGRRLDVCMVHAATCQEPDVPKTFVPVSELWERFVCGPEVKHSLEVDTGLLHSQFDLEAAQARFRKVLAILVAIGKPSSISEFLANNLDDECLPFRRLRAPGGGWQIHSARDPGVPCPPFQSWMGCDIDSFLGRQWQFMAPTFGRTRIGTPFFDLHHDTILPFTQVDRFNTGAFSTVYRAQLHPDNSLPPWSWAGSTEKSSRSDSQNPVQVAVKQLHSNDAHAFQNELRVLQLLSSKPHTHIVSLLGSYRLHDKYHFVFPWADSDLSMFWRRNPNPDRGHAMASWIARQMMGLADALRYIHGPIDPLDGVGKEHHGAWLGRHGDIKPSNILWYKNPDNDFGILQLADFGLSSLSHSCASRAETLENELLEKRQLRYTPAYKAPEFAFPSERIGRATDVWSLGCLFAEFATWFLLGSSGLEQLATHRMDDTDQNISSGGAFFELAEESDRKVARLKPKIEDWISRLQKHRHSSRFTDDILQLVLSKMLVMKTTRRSSARDVLEALTRIYHELDSDTSYADSRELRGLAFDDDGWYWATGGHPTLSDEQHEKTSSYLSVPLSHCENEVLTTSASQVHSSTLSDHSNKRKRAGDDDTTSQGHTGAATMKRAHHHKFACPFMKAGHDQSELNRACMGPGYDSIHRLKEHIQRCHTPTPFKNPLACNRCLRVFESANLHYKHSREGPQCLIKAPEIISGQLSLEQAISLRSIKKRRTDMADEDRWFEIFQILFPLKELPASPYHEDLTVFSLNTISTQSSTGISEYKDHLRRPMSDDEQRLLGEKLGRAIGILNPDLCKKLAAAFREHQLTDVQMFDRQKLEPVYGIPAMENNTPKGETTFLDVQVSGAPPEADESEREFERWMKEYGAGEPGFDA